jgi:hypothetical protein
MNAERRLRAAPRGAPLALGSRWFRHDAVGSVPAVGNDFILVLVVVTALGFDFTNGFHDTGNAMATSIATGALPPRIAVAVSGVLNLVGAFLSFAVAATIASGLVDSGIVTLTVVFAGLVGGICGTWLPGTSAFPRARPTPLSVVSLARRSRRPDHTPSSGTTWSRR